MQDVLLLSRPLSGANAARLDQLLESQVDLMKHPIRGEPFFDKFVDTDAGDAELFIQKGLALCL